MLCWINGQYTDESEVKIPPFDHGFLYGLGFYEVFRTYKGNVVFFEERFNRLCTSLNYYSIEMPYTMTDLLKVVHDFTEQTREDGIIRLTVSAGVHDLELSHQYLEPSVLVLRRPLTIRQRSLEKKAVWLRTRRFTTEQHMGLKLRHFDHDILARKEIKNLQEVEGVFLTQNGFIAEGLTSNIFWVRDGILFTPTLKTGIIPGITRKWVILMAKKLGVRVIEGFFLQSELESAHECFITNSIEELVPISKIGRKNFLGNEGPIYQRLHHAYIDEIIRTTKRGRIC